MLDWLEAHVGLVCWSAGASVVMMMGAAVALVCLPSDYFAKSENSSQGRGRFRVLRNVLGWLLVLSGVAMLILPGPGALILLFGLSLTELPGKQRVVRWVLSRGPVLRSANRLRRIFGRDALEPPESGTTSRSTPADSKRSKPKPV